MSSKGNFQRKYNVVPSNNSNSQDADCSPIVEIFKKYQIELDARYDKYERLVKKSRDLTIESKRIIFLLHRVSCVEEDDKILKEAELRLSALCKDVISTISVELSKQEVYQFIRAFSAGLQEFVEAISFYYYLKYGKLVSLEEVHKPDFLQVNQDSSDSIPIQKELLGVQFYELLTPSDYILGIADLTGELMRKCINSVGSGNIDEPFDLCLVLKNIHDALITCNSNNCRELKRKFVVLKSSLQKVENACYTIKIRGSEIPKHMLADVFSSDYEYKDTVECDL